MSMLTLALPRSPRSLGAAAALACLVEPPRAEGQRSRKRTTVEVAEEEFLKVSSATKKLQEELDGLLAKAGTSTNARTMVAVQNKRVKLSVMRGDTLPKAKEKLDNARKKAADVKALAEDKAAQDKKKKDMNGAFSDAFVCALVEVRLAAQDRMDNTSDKNLAVWQHIMAELHKAIDEGSYDECNRRTADSYIQRWTTEVSAYRQWCAVCNRACTQSGISADDVLEKVQTHQRCTT